MQTANPLAPKRSSKAKQGRPTNRPPAELLLELRCYYSIAQIASMYGVAEPTVKGWLRKYGITGNYHRKAKQQAHTVATA